MRKKNSEYLLWYNNDFLIYKIEVINYLNDYVNDYNPL